VTTAADEYRHRRRALIVGPVTGIFPATLPLGEVMTETKEPAIIEEALRVIDQGLTEMLHRELVSTSEVADLLLDVRTLLAPRTDSDEVPAGA
jgi:hypothetical protein